MLRLQILCTLFVALASFSAVLPGNALPVNNLARGDASTGRTGSTDGGSVSNSAGPDGTVTNSDGSALGGAGGTSTSGTPDGDNETGGDAGSASGGNVVNTGGTIDNDGSSSIGGAGGTSSTPDVNGTDPDADSEDSDGEVINNGVITANDLD